MKIFKNIKNLPFTKEVNKAKKNLIQEVGFDFYFMNKYNLSDIEWIIESILNKYHEDAFDNTNLSSNIFNYFENKRINSIQEKNLIKFEEEKYDPNKFISLLNKEKNIVKKHTRVLNLKRYNSLITNMKNITKKSNEKISTLINNEANNNRLEKSKLSSRNRPIQIKDKLYKSISNLNEEKKNYLSQKNRNMNMNIFSAKKNNHNYYRNNNNLSRNFSSGLSQGKTTDSFISDISVNFNFASFNNAYVTKLNYNINKSNVIKDFEIIKFNILNNINSLENEINKISYI